MVPEPPREPNTRERALEALRRSDGLDIVELAVVLDEDSELGRAKLSQALNRAIKAGLVVFSGAKMDRTYHLVAAKTLPPPVVPSGARPMPAEWKRPRRLLARATTVENAQHPPAEPVIDASQEVADVAEAERAPNDPEARQRWRVETIVAEPTSRELWFRVIRGQLEARKHGRRASEPRPQSQDYSSAMCPPSDMPSETASSSDCFAAALVGAAPSRPPTAC